MSQYLDSTLGLCQLVVLVDIGGLPRIANPHIRNGDCSQIAIVVKHILGKMTLLVLVLVMQHKYREFGLLGSTRLLTCLLDVLFQLTNSILEGGASVVNLIHDQDVLANQVGHFERGKIQPLCAGDFGTRLLYWVAT
jgi:hypothetical protein